MTSSPASSHNPHQSSLLAEARQGNPHAISTLLNRQLKAQHIRVSVTRQDSQLCILIEGPKPPPQKVTVNYLKTAFRKLNVPTIQKLYLFGGQMGQEIPAWATTVTLKPALPAQPSPAVPLSTKSTASPVLERSNLISNLFSVLPCFTLAGWFIVAGLNANILGGVAATRTFSIVLLTTEFITLQASGLMLWVGLDTGLPQPKKNKQLGLMAIVFCTIAVFLALGFRTWWPILSLFALTISRLLSAHFNILPQGQERQLAQRRWGAGTILGVGLLLCKSGVPFLPLGFLYFTLMGVSELLDHNFVSLSYFGSLRNFLSKVLRTDSTEHLSTLGKVLRTNSATKSASTSQTDLADFEAVAEAMTVDTLLKAQQGDEQAITTLLNYHVWVLGAKAKVVSDARGLCIRLDGQAALPQSQTCQRLRDALKDVPIQTVTVFSCPNGTRVPEWYQTISLTPVQGVPAPSLQQPPQNTLIFLRQWVLFNALAITTILGCAAIILSLTVLAMDWGNPLLCWGIAIGVLIILNSFAFSTAQAQALKHKLPQTQQWKKATFIGLLLGVPISLGLSPVLLTALAMTQAEIVPGVLRDFLATYGLDNLAKETVLPLAAFLGLTGAFAFLVLPLGLQVRVLKSYLHPRKMMIWVATNLLSLVLAPVVGFIMGGLVLMMPMVILASSLPESSGPVTQVLVSILFTAGLGLPIVTAFHLITGLVLNVILSKSA